MDASQHAPAPAPPSGSGGRANGDTSPPSRDAGDAQEEAEQQQQQQQEEEEEPEDPTPEPDLVTASDAEALAQALESLVVEEAAAAAERQQASAPSDAQAPEPLTKPVTANQATTLLDSFDLQGIAALIKAGRVRNVVCMVGAGISVSAGIPDFRTPGTGLYSQLAKYNLPRPEAVFSLDHFRRNPAPFHKLAKELFPGEYTPTPTHFFMHLLHQKGLLLRCFSQNIDGLEYLAGLPREKVVQAHGGFSSAACIECGHKHDVEWVKAQILADRICECTRCPGLVKPDIVFFGEALPDEFERRVRSDMPRCDLLIVMGTSLVVHPFASLIYYVGQWVPRLLVNREVAGEATIYDMMSRHPSPGFQFNSPGNVRDALFLGDCDEGVARLAELLGWADEFDRAVREGQARMREVIEANKRAREAAAGPGSTQDGKAGCSCL